MKKYILTIAAVFCITFIGGVTFAFAQQSVPIFHDKGESAPIGGIAVLVAAGGGYALKKLNDKKKV